MNNFFLYPSRSLMYFGINWENHNFHGKSSNIKPQRNRNLFVSVLFLHIRMKQDTFSSPIACLVFFPHVTHTSQNDKHVCIFNQVAFNELINLNEHSLLYTKNNRLMIKTKIDSLPCSSRHAESDIQIRE